MFRIMLKEWRESLAFMALYLFGVLLVGRLVAPAVPALASARAEVSALLVLGFVVLAPTLW